MKHTGMYSRRNCYILGNVNQVLCELISVILFVDNRVEFNVKLILLQRCRDNKEININLPIILSKRKYL